MVQLFERAGGVVVFAVLPDATADNPLLDGWTVRGWALRGAWSRCVARLTSACACHPRMVSLPRFNPGDGTV